jgi:hypothetical protein
VLSVVLVLAGAGEQIIKLTAWLGQGAAAGEAPLLRGLRSMPLPRSSGRQPRLLAGPELEPLRADGYRSMVRWQAMSLAFHSTAACISLCHGILPRLLSQTSPAFPQLLPQPIPHPALPCCRQVAPFLRGEWHTNKIGLLAPAEQRIQLAVDAMLGAVPVWFKASPRLACCCRPRLPLTLSTCLELSSH